MTERKEVADRITEAMLDAGASVISSFSAEVALAV
jgi:hypothetical protein